MIGFDTLFGDTVSIIKNWEPEKEYNNEIEYRNDLLDLLRKKINSIQNPILGNQNRISVTKEDGRGLCDIGIDRKIGIELKKDLKKKSQVDRLAGQILLFKKDYHDLIIVLVGKTDPEGLETLKVSIDSLSSNSSNYGLNQALRIKIIDKGSQIKKIKKEPKSGKGQYASEPIPTYYNREAYNRLKELTKW